MLNEWFRERLTKLPIEEKQICCPTVINAIEKGIVFQFHADASNRNRVYEALGVSEWEGSNWLVHKGEYRE
jgi:hypothetical protein